MRCLLFPDGEVGKRLHQPSSRVTHEPEDANWDQAPQSLLTTSIPSAPHSSGPGARPRKRAQRKARRHQEDSLAFTLVFFACKLPLVGGSTGDRVTAAVLLGSDPLEALLRRCCPTVPAWTDSCLWSRRVSSGSDRRSAPPQVRTLERRTLYSLVVTWILLMYQNQGSIKLPQACGHSFG